MALADIEFKLIDNSIKVKAEINDKTIAWLYRTVADIASHAKMNCKMEDDAGVQLKSSYGFKVDEGKGVGYVGSPLESAFWEEFGTGHYADQSKNGGKPGREDWWIYIRNNPNPRSDTRHYKSQKQAEYVAKWLRETKGLDAVATRGREPNYTLEKAFDARKGLAIKDFANTMKK